MNRLHPRIQIVWALRAVAFAVVAGGLVGIAHLAFDVPRWTVVAVAGLVLAVAVAVALARYRRWGYELREDALYLEHGVFTEVRIVVPFVRIQHVDSRRRPIERLLGLASTVVYTAGSRGADVRIPGLTPTEAQELRERLKELSIATGEGEDDAV